MATIKWSSGVADAKASASSFAGLIVVALSMILLPSQHYVQVMPVLIPPDGVFTGRKCVLKKYTNLLMGSSFTDHVNTFDQIHGAVGLYPWATDSWTVTLQGTQYRGFRFLTYVPENGILRPATPRWSLTILKNAVSSVGGYARRIICDHRHRRREYKKNHCQQ